MLQILWKFVKSLLIFTLTAALTFCTLFVTFALTNADVTVGIMLILFLAPIAAGTIMLKLIKRKSRKDSAEKTEPLEETANAETLALTEPSPAPIPASEKPTPVIEEPVVEEPAPVTEEHEPVIEESAPEIEALAPAIKEPTPVIEEPEIEEPKPAPAPRAAALEQPTPRATRRFTEKTKTYKVAGVTHYTENIMNLSSENSDYFLSKRELIEEDLTNERIWKYEFYPERVELVPEPDNPEDRNAIKVIVDDEHVGYIKRGSCTHVHTLLNTGNITSITCTIGGGPYKYISEEYDDERDKEVYTLEKDETTLFVRLEISEKVLVPVTEEVRREAPPKKDQEAPRRTFFEDDIDDGIKRTYCINCGKEVGDALVCPHCGKRTEKDPWKSVSATSVHGESDKDKWVAFFLCLFLGGIGAHRFYVGKIGSGILYLFTGGVFGIGTLIDFIMILCGAFTDEDGRILE